MNKKTRRIIGNILIWGGLGVITLASALQLVNSPTPVLQLGADTFPQAMLVLKAKTYLASAWANLGSVVAIVIGGLWGMKR